jgi:hypothetical protein
MRWRRLDVARWGHVIQGVRPLLLEEWPEEERALVFFDPPNRRAVQR